MLIRAKDASFAATLPMETAAIRQAGNIAMGTVTANASGAATKPSEAIAVTRHTASTNCKPTHKALRINLIAYPLRVRSTRTETPPDSREVKLNKGTGRKER